MKVRYKTDGMEIEVEGKDTTACFDELARAAEVFGQNRCGACDNTDIRLVTREAKGFTFREAFCCECKAALAFGVKKADGSLFPRRKDEDGNWLENNGWVMYRPASDASPF